MISFSIIALGDFVSPKGCDVMMKAFANFYHSVTSKHQRRISLYIIDDAANVDNIAKACILHKIEEPTSILHLEEQDDIIKLYKSGSLFLFPVQQRKEAIIQESLSYGLPILSYAGLGYEEYIDQTCGMLLKTTSPEEDILEYARLLQLLYFDPEAREFMKRGALNKYKAHFSWGMDKPKRARTR